MAWSNFDKTKPTDTRRWDLSDDDIRTNWTALVDTFKDAGQYASVNAAVTAIGATQTVLRISESETLTANITFPSTLTVVFASGGMLVKASTYTVTFNGPLHAGPYQILSGFGSSDVTMGVFAKSGILPEWWGIDGTADEVQINYALKVAGSYSTVKLTQSAYTCAAAIVFSDTAATITQKNLFGYGAVITSTSTGDIISIGDGTYATNNCVIKGISFNSETAYYGINITGLTVNGCRFQDLLIGGKATSLTGSTGISIVPTGGGCYENVFRDIYLHKWDVCISLFYDWPNTTAGSDPNAPNANVFDYCHMANFDSYGVYVYDVVGCYWNVEFTAGTGATANFELNTTANNHNINIRGESSATAGIIVGSDCQGNVINAAMMTDSITDNHAAKKSIIFHGANTPLIYVPSLKCTDVSPLLLYVDFYKATDTSLQLATITKTLDFDAAGTTDFVCDNTQVNVTEQPIDFGAIIPAYAEIVSCQVRCIEAVLDAGVQTMSIDVGTSSGGAEILATADTDTLNEINSTGAGDGPEVVATNAARNLWVNLTPGANWSTLTAGKWVVMVSFIDYGRAKTLKI